MPLKKNGQLKNQLHVFRAQKGWTQKEVADQLGISRQTIISLEANKYTPSLVLAFEIATLFETDINQIFQYEIEEEASC